MLFSALIRKPFNAMKCRDSQLMEVMTISDEKTFLLLPLRLMDTGRM